MSTKWVQVHTARVRLWDASTGTVTTALSQSCVDSRGERGILGIAFSPDYLNIDGQSRFAYLFYTRNFTNSGICQETGYPTGTRIRVSRFTETSGQLFNEDVVFEGPNLTGATNHNGGTIRFGADKTLYISIGDNDTDANSNPLSRDLSDVRGKIHRINADGTIPGDNPFVGTAGALDSIWAWGLRNPFRFGIDTDSDTLFIADVGEGTWEAIYTGIPGADYGYPCFEGSSSFRTCTPAPAAGTVTQPVLEYGHGSQTPPVSGNSITGGPVYRHTAFPADYHGSYFFADYGGQWMRRARVTQDNQLVEVEIFMPDAGGVVDIIVSPAGCLTYAGIFGEGIREVCYTGGSNGQPNAVATATPTSGQAPLGVNFTGSLSTDPDDDDLDFDWEFDDGFDSTDEDPIHSYTITGVYDVQLTVDDQQLESNSTDTAPPISIVVGNDSPTPTILAPTSGTTYDAGDTINFSGSGADTQDGPLGVSDLSWNIAFHHDTHVHPFLGPITGVSSGNFTIPTSGEDATDVFYRVYLTATDSGNPIGISGKLSTTIFVDITPNLADITLSTFPSGVGLELEFNRSPGTEPLVNASVVNFSRVIGAPSPQFADGRNWEFTSWSDAGDAEHTINAPAANTNYIATYSCTTNCSCTGNLNLSNDTINTTQAYQGCASIIAGDNWVVGSTGNVTFQSGDIIYLDPGFAIAPGGEFSAGVFE